MEHANIKYHRRNDSQHSGGILSADDTRPNRLFTYRSSTRLSTGQRSPCNYEASVNSLLRMNYAKVNTG